MCPVSVCASKVRRCVPSPSRTCHNRSSAGGFDEKPEVITPFVARAVRFTSKGSSTLAVMSPETDFNNALADNPRTAIFPLPVLTSRFADAGTLTVRSITVFAFAGIRDAEIARNLPRLSITIGERVCPVDHCPLTTAETTTYCCSQTSVVTSPKRFSTRTRASGGRSIRMPSW